MDTIADKKIKEICWKLDREIWAHVPGGGQTEPWTASKAREESAKLIYEYFGSIEEFRKANENQRQTIKAQAEGIINVNYIFQRVFTDNGEHSHWTVIRMSDGVKVWSEAPEECKAMGYAVEELREEIEHLKALLRNRDAYIETLEAKRESATS